MSNKFEEEDLSRNCQETRNSVQTDTTHWCEGLTKKIAPTATGAKNTKKQDLSSAKPSQALCTFADFLAPIRPPPQDMLISRMLPLI